MATSDNVLRAGLTAKPVDVDGLLAVVDESVRPPRLLRGEPTGPGQVRFTPPVGDFELLLAEPGEAGTAVTLDEAGPRLLLVLQSTTLAADGVALHPGELFWLDRSEAVQLTGAGCAAVVGTRGGGTLT
jgi:mannose-6-phosphate isomerase